MMGLGGERGWVRVAFVYCHSKDTRRVILWDVKLRRDIDYNSSPKIIIITILGEANPNHNYLETVWRKRRVQSTGTRKRLKIHDSFNLVTGRRFLSVQ